MDRRSLLRLGATALPLSLAGCSDGDPGGETPTSSPSPTRTPTSTPTSTPTATPGTDETRVEVTETATQPDVDVEYAVEMAEPLATAEHPARLQVTISNPTDQKVVLGEERAVQFHHVSSQDEALYLVPAGGGNSTGADEGCWRLTEPVAVAEYYGTVTVPPGDSLVAASQVYGRWDLPEGVCLPEGEHRMLTSGRAADSAEGVLEDEGGTDFEWGFTLQVGAVE